MNVLGREVRAFDVFRVSLALSFMSFLSFLFVSIALNAIHGELTDAESNALLGLLYWGTYPLVFVALVSLTRHFIQHYRGAYAPR